MKILLINPPDGERRVGHERIARIEPLGLELVGAAVVDEHEVRLVDLLARSDDLETTLAEWTPDVAGATSDSDRVETALAALARVRRSAPRCLTIVGGRHATLHPEGFDDPAVDLVVLGEGVDCFAEVCEARAAGSRSFEHIAGLQIRDRSGIAKTRPRPLPKTLDHQPIPARWLTDHYREHYFFGCDRPVAAIRTSVGCGHPCSFCPSRNYSQAAFIPRAPELVFEEIRDLDEDFVVFCDDQPFFDPNRMRILGRMLLEAGVKKRYFAYVRSDSIVDHRNLFALWAEVGLTLVTTGPATRDAHRPRNATVVRILEQLGIRHSAGRHAGPDAPVAKPAAAEAGPQRSLPALPAESTPPQPLAGAR